MSASSMSPSDTPSEAPSLADLSEAVAYRAKGVEWTDDVMTFANSLRIGRPEVAANASGRNSMRPSRSQRRRTRTVSQQTPQPPSYRTVSDGPTARSSSGVVGESGVSIATAGC